jgi:hypothetical protein
MGRPPRASTPSPTVPPPLPNPTGESYPPLEQVKKRIEWWKVAIGAVVCVFLAGWSFRAWDAEHATKDDVSHAAATNSASVDVLKARTEAALDALDRQANNLRERVAGAERDLDWLKAGVYELLKRQGATASVPPPPP